jgi:glycerol-3-phosphate dehydrogenase
MAEELKWDEKRKNLEWKDTVQFLTSMGLPQSRVNITRKEVEEGKTRILIEGKPSSARTGMFSFPSTF